MLKDWIISIPYIQHTGYFIAFLAAFLEALPVIGLVIPGQTIVAAAGFLAYQELLNWYVVALLAIIGAILGDLLGYYVGLKYGVTFVKKKRGMVFDAMQLLKEHPIKTLILGRFNSLTRAFAPFAAGASKLNFRIFMFANIAGGILWGLTWTGIGFIFGAGYELVSSKFETAVLLAFFLGGSLFFIYRHLKKKYGMSDKAMVLVGVCALSLIFFAFLVSGINSSLVRALDNSVASMFSGALPNFVLAISLMSSAIVTPLVLFSFGTPLLFWLAIKKMYREGALVLISVFGGVLLNFLVKGIVQRARPDGSSLWASTYASHSFVAVESFSFPSGHALLATVLFVSLALALKKQFSKPIIIAIVCTLSAFAVMSSRVIIGVHYATDILGGAMLGLFWVSFVFLINEMLLARKKGRAITPIKTPNK